MISFHHISVYVLLLLALSTKLTAGSDNLPLHGQDTANAVRMVDDKYNRRSKTRVKRIFILSCSLKLNACRKEKDKHYAAYLRVTRELASLRNTYNKNVNEITNLRKNNGRLKQANTNYQNKIKTLENQRRKEKTTSQQKLKKLSSRLKHRESQLRKDKAKYRENIERLESRLLNETAILRQNTSMLNTKIRELKEKISELEDTNTELQSAAAELQKDIRSLKSQQKEDKTKCQESIQRLESQLMNTTVICQQNTSVLNTEIRELKEKNSGLEDANAELQNTAEKCQQMYNAVQGLASETCGCPENWQQYEAQCYRFMKQEVTFIHGNTACQKMNASLATENEANMDFLIANMYKSFGQWIGYEWRNKTVRNWSDRTPVDPDYVTQRMHDDHIPYYDPGCVAVTKSRDGTYNWVVGECSGNRASSVCQRNADCSATVSVAQLQKALQAYE